MVRPPVITTIHHIEEWVLLERLAPLKIPIGQTWGSSALTKNSLITAVPSRPEPQGESICVYANSFDVNRAKPTSASCRERDASGRTPPSPLHPIHLTHFISILQLACSGAASGPLGGAKHARRCNRLEMPLISCFAGGVVGGLFTEIPMLSGTCSLSSR